VSKHQSMIRVAAPGERPRWIVPKSTPCHGGCGKRIEPAEFRVRVKLGGRNRDYHRECIERLGVRVD
jgi:hypothetical protein